MVASSGLVEKLQSVDRLLSTEGPTINVFEQYEDLVREMENARKEGDGGEDSSVVLQLSKLYFKKALVALSLNKQNSAIYDLRTCLSLDPMMKPARKRLVDLYMEKGDFDSVELMLSEDHEKDDPSFAETSSKIFQYKESLNNAKQWLANGEAQNCLDELEHNVIPISPNNLDVYKLHVECIRAKGDQLSDDDFRQIIQDYSQMIKAQPMKVGLDAYDEVASYLLFSQNEFEKSWAIVKNCLRIDNDFKKCGNKSKFYFKFQDFFKILERYSIINGYYYMENADASLGLVEDSLLVNDEEFKWVYQFLFKDNLKVSNREKRSLPYSITNNYEYLKEMFNNFVQEDKLEQSADKLNFMDQLAKLGCEASVVQGATGSYCEDVKDNDSNPFLPLYLKKIDKLIRKKNFGEADALMQKFNKNLQQSRQFQDRYSHIENYHRMEQQRQQREHQRQQQEQQQRYHQQQQQQQQQQQFGDVDYYKVLDISKDADEKTIKKAHRTQTLKYHPDKYKGTDFTPEEIEAKMQEINMAYEVLGNKETREQYDNPNRGGGGGGFGGGGNPFGGGGFGGFDSSFFNQFGGGGFQFGGNGGPKVKFQRGR